jgi:hypothetical protein
MIDDKNVAQEAAAEVPNEPVETQVEEQAPASLSIQDLANVRRLLDVASQRGAFKTDEFQVVGAIYGKLATFVDAAVAAQEQAKEAEAEPEATAGE